MMSQPGKQTIAIHILPNISRSKMQSANGIWSVNRIYHEEHFFLKSKTQNVVEKLFADPFLKNQN